MRKEQGEAGGLRLEACRKQVAGRTRRLSLSQASSLQPQASVFLCLLLFALCLHAPAAAQKRPKPALSERDARRAIAAVPGFALRESAVRVREISAAGVAPVTVSAEVTLGVRLASVEDERAAQTSDIFRTKRRRAVELRTGDRSWEEFDFLAAVLAPESVERARASVEELVTEFEARLRAAKGQAVEPLTRGPLTVKGLTSLGSSVVAELAVEATFRLVREGRWRVTEVLFGNFASGDVADLWRRVDARKAERVRADLAAVVDALERYRGERGFYVASDSEVVLMDHLSPFYIERVIRLDPWLRPYRYAGTRERFTLSSDGPDGKQGTPDDITLGR
jgi:Type II secretion system (T2SS), protein G